MTQACSSTLRTVSRCTCSWRAMVPTRHCSAWYRRRICARSSGAMAMVGHSSVAVTDGSLAHQGWARLATPVAAPGMGVGGRGGRDRRRGGAWWDGQGGCLRGWQYIIRGPVLRTLMRHYLCQRCLARTPALGTQCVLEAPRATTLVTSGGVALQRPAGRGRAPIGAIPLTSVALAAHQHLYAATRAQEESGGLVGHGHPWAMPKVCWTGSPTGATIKLHPVYDTVKGAAVGTYLSVGTAAAPAYFGVGPLQRSRQTPVDPRKTATKFAVPHGASSTTEIRRPTAWHIQRRACPCPPDRADRDRGHPKPEHPGIKTALSKPENSGSCQPFTTNGCDGGYDVMHGNNGAARATANSGNAGSACARLGTQARARMAHGD